MKKVGVFLILLAFLCVGQGFGPKIVKGPTPGNVASQGTGVSGLAYWWVSSDVTANHVISNQWLDRIQGKQQVGYSSPTNGPSGIWYNGTAAYTSNSTAAINWGSVRMSVFVGFTPVTPTAGVNCALLGSAASTAYGIYTKNDGATLYSFGTGNGQVGVYSSGTEMTLCATFAADNYTGWYTDGTSYMSNTVIGPIPDPWAYCGRDARASGNFYKGYIREIQVYTNKVLTPGEVTTIQNYYNTTYP